MTAAVSRGHNTEPSPRKLRWRTPLDLFRQVQAREALDFDAAAEDDRLLPRWISPAQDCLVTPWADFGRRAWFQPPWGPRSAAFRGTGVYVDRATGMADTLDVVVMLVPTAPDTSWWRRAFCRSDEVRLLRRVPFVDPDTGEVGKAPPGAGVTLFRLPGIRPCRPPHVLVCDAQGVEEGA